MSKEYADMLWQIPDEDSCIAEPAIAIQLCDDVIVLVAAEKEITAAAIGTIRLLEAETRTLTERVQELESALAKTKGNLR